MIVLSADTNTSDLLRTAIVDGARDECDGGDTGGAPSGENISIG